MNPEPSTDELVEAYLAWCTNSWSREYMTELVRKRPADAWSVIVQLLDRAPTDDAIATIAAGPLEDLMSLHGADFIESATTLARNNPKFQRALSGVWHQDGMSPKVWRQLQKIARG